MRFSAFSSRAPVNTTALVVPSPAELSRDWATSTNILAAGCSMDISCKIVAPSFVMVISPRGLTNILSIPLGPRVLLTMLATAFAAAIFILSTSFPFVCSFLGSIIIIGWPALSIGTKTSSKYPICTEGILLDNLNLFLTWLQI